MVWTRSLIRNRFLFDSRGFWLKFVPKISFSQLPRIQFNRISSKSTNSSPYAWNFVNTPSENQVLFANLIDELSVNSVGKGNQRDLLKLPDKNQLKQLVYTCDDKTVDIQQIHQQIVDIVKRGGPNCLKSTSTALQANSACLFSLTSPFDNHWKFIKNLDSRLVNHLNRRKDWHRSQFIDECLQLAIDLYKFSPPTTMVFYDNLVQGIIGKVDNLTKKQFLVLMFCCVLSRRQMSGQQIQWCQRFIDRNLDSLSPANLSLILIAFHKTQSHLVDDKLYKKILIKITTEAKSITDATLRSSLLKGINYSLILAESKLVEKFVSSFMKLDNLSVFNYIHLNEFCVKQKVYIPELIEKSICILENAIEHLREKDIDRILKCATAFDHFQPPCSHIHRVVDQLDSRIAEVEQIYLEKTVPSVLRSTFLLDIYPPNMINFVLSQDWVSKLNFYSKDVHTSYWLLMTIRDGLMIDRHSEYKGRLTSLDFVYNKGIQNEKLRVPISLFTRSDSNRLSLNNRNLADLYKATCDAFSDRYVQLGYALSTSLTPDLMLTTEPKHIRLLKGPIRTPDCFTKAYAIVYIGKQIYIDQTYSQISGHYRLREKLLQKLGFTVINIPFYEIYHKVDEFGNNEDLVEYIKKRINQLES